MPNLVAWGGSIYTLPPGHAGPLVGAGSMTWIACEKCGKMFLKKTGDGF